MDSSLMQKRQGQEWARTPSAHDMLASDACTSATSCTSE